MEALTDRAARYQDALKQAREAREEKARLDEEMSPVKERCKELSGQISELGKALELRSQRMKDTEKTMQIG